MERLYKRFKVFVYLKHKEDKLKFIFSVLSLTYCLMSFVLCYFFDFKIVAIVQGIIGCLLLYIQSNSYLKSCIDFADIITLSFFKIVKEDVLKDKNTTTFYAFKTKSEDYEKFKSIVLKMFVYNSEEYISDTINMVRDFVYKEKQEEQKREQQTRKMWDDVLNDYIFRKHNVKSSKFYAALSFFNLSETEFNEYTLKKKYREFVKKYHSDSVNGDRNKFEETQQNYEYLKQYV